LFVLFVAAAVCSCRTNKQSSAGAGADAAAGDAAAGADAHTQPPPASTADATVNAWATWPMPNATPGLPNPQSFDTQKAGVVLDRVTGLMWQSAVDADKFSTFSEAAQRCEALTLAGFDDWRIPSRIELVSILDVTRTQPAINAAAFSSVPSDWFWTSSVAADNPQAAWYVYFYFGYPKTDLISNQFLVRCVRSSVAHPAPATHYDTQTDTVRDLGTGLTWQRAVPDQTFTFDAARTYCSTLSLGGKKLWRLPSLTELLTLIDERAATGPMIDRVAFPNTPSEPFWSGTYFGADPQMSWQVYFDHGNGLYGLPSATFRARCVL
jgi:hypothetical protein